MDYIGVFLYIEPFLPPGDESYLIVVNDHSDVFLDSVGKNFIEYFCINVHKGKSYEVLFLCLVFGLGISVVLLVFRFYGMVEEYWH